MSGTSVPGPTPAGDPSMEDILASIRKILSDDEPKPEVPAPSAPEPHGVGDDVLMLDASMLVQPPPTVAELPVAPQPVAMPEPAPPPIMSLVAPEAAAAAASSVDALVRTLHSEQAMRVTAQGPTIEEIVRQEIRPILKDWLDTHLPPLVERLVRTEIERVVGRVRT